METYEQFRQSDGYFYFIYKTVNKVNHRFYIGKHKTKRIDDNYPGSGLDLKRDIKEFGREQFERIIIEFSDSCKNLFELEQKIVTKELIDDPLCYNMTIGGGGELRDQSIIIKKSWQSQKLKDKQSRIHKEFWDNVSDDRKELHGKSVSKGQTIKVREKMSNIKKEHFLKEENRLAQSKRKKAAHLNNPAEAKRHSELMKEKFKDEEYLLAHKKRQKEICNTPEAKKNYSLGKLGKKKMIKDGIMKFIELDQIENMKKEGWVMYGMSREEYLKNRKEKRKKI